VKVHSLTADVAVADYDGKISGIHGADGAAGPDFPHHVTLVFVKKDGKWMVSAARAFQFTDKPGAKK
jgi:hypothetical protein